MLQDSKTYQDKSAFHSILAELNEELEKIARKMAFSTQDNWEIVKSFCVPKDENSLWFSQDQPAAPWLENCYKYMSLSPEKWQAAQVVEQNTLEAIKTLAKQQPSAVIPIEDAVQAIFLGCLFFFMISSAKKWPLKTLCIAFFQGYQGVCMGGCNFSLIAPFIAGKHFPGRIQQNFHNLPATLYGEPPGNF